MWAEVEVTKKENKRELKLAGAAIAERINSHGLDKHIFDLTVLNLLNISEATLKVLPNEISNLNNLQTILLYGNELETLPPSIGQLEKLKVLDVSRNKLRSLPVEIANLVNLAAINLSANELDDFPSLRVCSKLGVLDLSNNRLQKFPDICDEQLSNLSDVNFKGNLIPLIPNEIALLSSLKHLNLVSNKLTALPKILASMPKLKGKIFYSIFCRFLKISVRSRSAIGRQSHC